MATNTEFRFELTIRLGDMEPEDAFRIFVSLELSNYTLDTFLSRLFEESFVGDIPINLLMDVNENPDLPDMFNELVNIYNQWKLNKCSIRFLKPNGKCINPTDLLSDHIQSLKLHLIFEQKYEMFPASKTIDSNQITLLKWLQEITMLYAIDRSMDGISAGDELVLENPIVNLISRQLVILNNVTEKYEIGTKGRDYIIDLVSETEGYIDQYDIFHDVTFDYETRLIEFGSGEGEDFRVPVFQNEGLDPARTVFLLRIFDGTLNEYLDTCHKMIYSTSFYNEILRPVLDHPIIPEDILDWVIENGLDYLDEYNENTKLQEVRY